MCPDHEPRQVSSARQSLLRDKKSVINKFTPSEAQFESIADDPNQYERFMAGENEAGQLLDKEEDVDLFSETDTLGTAYAIESIDDVVANPERVRSYFFDGVSKCVSRLSQSEFGLRAQVFNSIVIGFVLGIPLLLLSSTADPTMLLPLTLVGAAIGTFGFELGHRYLSYGTPLAVDDDIDEEYDPWSVVKVLTVVQAVLFLIAINLAGVVTTTFRAVLFTPILGTFALVSLYACSKFVKVAWLTAYPEHGQATTKYPSIPTFFAVGPTALFVIGLLVVVFSPMAGFFLLSGLLVPLVAGPLLAGLVLLGQLVILNR